MSCFLSLLVIDISDIDISLHRKVLEQRDEIYEKIAQYLQLKNIIERLQVIQKSFQPVYSTLQSCDVLLCCSRH